MTHAPGAPSYARSGALRRSPASTTASRSAATSPAVARHDTNAARWQIAVPRAARRCGRRRPPRRPWPGSGGSARRAALRRSSRRAGSGSTRCSSVPGAVSSRRGEASTSAASSCASSQQRETTSTTPVTTVLLQRRPDAGSTPASARLDPELVQIRARAGRQVRRAAREGLAVELRVLDQHEPDAVRHVQPLVRVDCERVRALDARRRARAPAPRGGRTRRRRRRRAARCRAPRRRRRSRRSGRRRRC